MSLRAIFAVFVLVSLAGCPNCGRRDLDDDDDAGTDAGEISCTTVADCPDPNTYDCLGVCLQRCAADATCPDGTYCDAEGHCRGGCRDSTTCAEGTFCDDGDCVAGEGCATKCDCAPGQVCIESSCTDPPTSCDSAADCGRGQGEQCEDYACNGFTHKCFDDDPDPCTNADDCIGRPGCEEGCACTGNQQCVPAVDCTVDDEETTCGAGFYCDGNGDCQVLPACTNDSPCVSLNLYCNVGQGQCERAQGCTSSTTCTTAPATYCDVPNERCVVPTCNNGGVTCTTAQTCSTDGRCINGGSGTTCTSHTSCAADEYCDFSVNGGSCLDGCRNNAACDSSQVCDGSHTCVANGGGGGGQYGETCAADEDCQAGLICGLLTQTCAEPCGAAGTQCTAGDPNCCPLSGQPYCNDFGFCRPEP
jgi:hypothetical protein